MGISWVLACSGAPVGGSVVGEGGSGGAGNAGSGSGGLSAMGGGLPVLGGGSGGFFPLTDAGVEPPDPPSEEQNLIALRIEPADFALDVLLGHARTLEYRAFGKFASAPDQEVELTERTVFYVPDNHLVGAFPADGANLLTTRVPAGVDDPAQRGGSLTVRAQAASSDGSVSTATTRLDVRLTGARLPTEPGALDPALPDNPAQHFAGTLDAARAPTLVYPNDGVLLPPNLGELEVHFLRGAPENVLFEVQLSSAASTLTYYTRCHSDPAEFVEGACALVIGGEEFDNLAASNPGTGPVALSVRGSDENGTWGKSAEFEIEFAEKRIDGAVYYWTTSHETSIERFDFGSGQTEPEMFVKNMGESNETCVGCHTLSRQGDKAFFSIGNSDDGFLMYVDDMAVSTDDPGFYAYDGMQNANNRVLTGSFDPEGTQFVAAAPVNDPEPETKLFFHDGMTGVRQSSVTLPFIAGQPDWSPLGDQIAVTSIPGGRNRATISFLRGGISLIQRTDGVWDGDNPIDVVPANVAGKNRFNPTFFPEFASGKTLLLYSEVDQQSAYEAGSTYAAACDAAGAPASDNPCDGYSDPGAKTWAVAPTGGALPVLLENAARPGVADQLAGASFGLPDLQVERGVKPTALMDTYPKAAPFITPHRGAQIGWFTVGSQRRAGLRKPTLQDTVVGTPPRIRMQSLLWMFALEPSAVLAGQDGSRPGFFLPFQDLKTSNHMAQWTERIVSDSPPPAAPTPPPPAPPPAPPPPPVIVR